MGFPRLLHVEVQVGFSRLLHVEEVQIEAGLLVLDLFHC